MAEAAFTRHSYRGCYQQSLRNVSLYVPSIIWVQTGVKHLLYQGSTLNIQDNNLLLAAAHDQLTFINLPKGRSFFSVQFCFYLLPDPEMLALSSSVSRQMSPELPLNKPLRQTLSMLSTLSFDAFSEATQKHWVYALYQQLAEVGKLHILFPDTSVSISQKISAYFRRDPSQKYQIEHICDGLNVSKATLLRRLKKENTSFREILLNVRLGQALSLMQNGESDLLTIALSCGYQSPERFSQQFTKIYGLTPKQYIKTI